MTMKRVFFLFTAVSRIFSGGVRRTEEQEHVSFLHVCLCRHARLCVDLLTVR